MFLVGVQHGSGVIFDCVYTITSRTSLGVGSVYQCSANSITSLRNNKIEAIQGNHLDGKSNLEVDFFLVIDEILNIIPENLERFFPRANLIELSADDLKPFPKLLSFTAPYNKLTNLGEDLFKFTPSIKYIDFYNNSIKNVGENLLGKLSDLKYANFQNNPCINVLTNDAQKITLLKTQLQGCPPKSSLSQFKISKTFLENVQCLIDNAKLETGLNATKTQLEELKILVSNYQKKIYEQTAILLAYNIKTTEDKEKIEVLEEKLNQHKSVLNLLYGGKFR